MINFLKFSVELGETQKDDKHGDKKLDGDDNEANDATEKRKTSNLSNDNDNDSSDEEQANDDGDDTTGIKLKSRKLDETEYDDPDDVEELLDGKSFLNIIFSINFDWKIKYLFPLSKCFNVFGNIGSHTTDVSLTSTLSDRFLRNFSWQSHLLLGFLPQIC